MLPVHCYCCLLWLKLWLRLKLWLMLQSAQKQGRRAWSLISTFTLKTTLDNLFITLKSVRRGLQELIKIFVFWQNNYLISEVIVNGRYIYTVYIRYFLAGKSPNIRSYTVHTYDSGQPYIYTACMTIFMAISLLEISYPHRMYVQTHGSGQP